MKKPKLRLASGEIGHRIVKTYVDKNGVECVDVEYADGLRMTLKISKPKDPFFKKLRKGLKGIPQLNIDEAISELRD